MADKCVLDYLKILNVRPQYAMQFLFMLLSLSICGLVGHPNTFYSNRPNPHRSPADDLWICSSPFCCAFSAFYWNCVSPSLKVYNYCLRDHTFSLVAAMHSFLPFFLRRVLLHIRHPERGLLCLTLPEGSCLAMQINNYRVHNIGENNLKIFDVKHERNQNYKEKKVDEERSWKMVFLSASRSLQYFLLLLLSTVSQCEH